MTPKRKEYLDGISYEERVIRQHIVGLKSTITILKTLCKEDRFACVLQKDKQEISKFKVIIKALKKQLPANKEQYLHWVDYCPNCLEKISNEANYCQNCGRQLFQYVCPICKASTEFRQDYCCKCGQKLR